MMHQLKSYSEAKPSLHQDNLEVIKWDTCLFEPDEVPNNTKTAEDSTSTIQQEKETSADQGENEEEGRESSTEVIPVDTDEDEQFNRSNRVESCDSENLNSMLEEEETTPQTESGQYFPSFEMVPVGGTWNFSSHQFKLMY
jgi:hypothetical protein